MLESGSAAAAGVPSGGCRLPAQAHGKSRPRFHGGRSKGDNKQRSRAADEEENWQELELERWGYTGLRVPS